MTSSSANKDLSKELMQYLWVIGICDLFSYQIFEIKKIVVTELLITTKILIFLFGLYYYDTHKQIEIYATCMHY